MIPGKANYSLLKLQITGERLVAAYRYKNMGLTMAYMFMFENNEKPVSHFAFSLVDKDIKSLTIKEINKENQKLFSPKNKKRLKVLVSKK